MYINKIVLFFLMHLSSVLANFGGLHPLLQASRLPVGTTAGSLLA